MLDHISTLEEIESEALVIDDFLTITCSESPIEAIERGNQLAVYLSRTGKLLADAKFHLNTAKKSDIMEMLTEVAKRTPFATSKAINNLVDAMCRKEQFMVDWVERQNRTCTHQIDFLRTVISYAKSDYSNSKGMRG